jgi:hypothetical protein
MYYGLGACALGQYLFAQSYHGLTVSNIVKFQLAECSDSQGRFIHEIWALDAFWLEHDHKYIQWLFPIDSQTKFNRHAPLLTLADMAEFKCSTELAKSLETSLNVMLSFFGMEWKNSEIIPSNTLNIRDHIWLKASGHNQQFVLGTNRIWSARCGKKYHPHH